MFERQMGGERSEWHHLLVLPCMDVSSRNSKRCLFGKQAMPLRRDMELHIERTIHLYPLNDWMRRLCCFQQRRKRMMEEPFFRLNLWVVMVMEEVENRKTVEMCSRIGILDACWMNMLMRLCDALWVWRLVRMYSKVCVW